MINDKKFTPETKINARKYPETGEEMSIDEKIDDPDYEFNEWSDELVKELRYRFRNGATTSQLAQKINIFEWAIREKLGLKAKEENMGL